MNNKLMYQLQILNQQNAKVSHQMSTKDALENGSDDARLYNYILGFEQDIRTYEGIQTQLNQATVYNTTSDSTLASYKEFVDAINSEVLVALNGTTDQTTKSSMSQSLQDTKESMFDLLNEKANGSYVYSGSDGTIEPFAMDSNGKVTYEGGADYKKTIVDEGLYKEQGLNGFDVAFYSTSVANTGETLDFSDEERLIDSNGDEWNFIDHDGDSVIDMDRIYKNGDSTGTFLSVTASTTTPIVYSAVNTEDVVIEAKHNFFDDLDEMIYALDSKDKNGDPITEEQGTQILSDSLEKIEQAYASANASHAVLGGKNASFESYSASTSAKLNNLEIYYTEFASADLTKAAIEAQALEMTYASLYSTISKVNSLSLTNYL
jgi:flagellar hook-associated protein 3 FlgL